MLESFIEKFPSDNNGEPIPTELIKKYTGVVPDELIFLWKEHGFGSYRDHYLWLVNPDDFRHLHTEWGGSCYLRLIYL